MGGSDGTGADSPSPDFALRERTAQAVDIGGQLLLVLVDGDGVHVPTGAAWKS